jgi:hypothetical protein
MSVLVDGHSAPKMRLNNLDRLVNWSNEFLGRTDTDRIYPVPIIRDKQVVMGTSAVDRDMEGENSKGVGLPGIEAAGSNLPRSGECWDPLVSIFIVRGIPAT